MHRKKEKEMRQLLECVLEAFQLKIKINSFPTLISYFYGQRKLKLKLKTLK